MKEFNENAIIFRWSWPEDWPEWWSHDQPVEYAITEHSRGDRLGGIVTWGRRGSKWRANPPALVFARLLLDANKENAALRARLENMEKAFQSTREYAVQWADTDDPESWRAALKFIVSSIGPKQEVSGTAAPEEEGRQDENELLRVRLAEAEQERDSYKQQLSQAERSPDGMWVARWAHNPLTVQADKNGPSGGLGEPSSE